jgi:hypothetical protein
MSENNLTTEAVVSLSISELVSLNHCRHPSVGQFEKSCLSIIEKLTTKIESLKSDLSQAQEALGEIEVSVRRRRIKERLDGIRKQESAMVNSQAFYGQIEAAIEKWRDKPLDLDDFLFDAFGPLGPVKQKQSDSAKG